MNVFKASLIPLRNNQLSKHTLMIINYQRNTTDKKISEKICDINAENVLQEIFVNPSLGNPSDLTSVTLLRERDTFK
jgi:hypothetical protein